MLLTTIVGYDVAHTPHVKAVENTPAPVATIQPTEQPKYDNEIEAYIHEVFGKHAEKAMYLLEGNGICGENHNLNPNAVNDNTTWGGVGRDCGVFQINDVYHPFTCEQLKDYKTNIDYAYRMFKNDNYTFVRWTAGRCLGI